MREGFQQQISRILVEDNFSTTDVLAMYTLAATGFYQNKEHRRAQSHILDDNTKVSYLKSEISGSTEKMIDSGFLRRL